MLNKGWEMRDCVVGDGTTIVQAWAEYRDPDDEEAGWRVYAGRLLKHAETIARGAYDPHILAVADELRERVEDDRFRRRVTNVVNICFRSFASPFSILDMTVLIGRC